MTVGVRVRRMVGRGLLGACLLGVAPASFAQSPPAAVMDYADRIFYNGAVLTVDSAQGDFTVAEAVAVRDGKFLAVGKTAEILQLAGPNTGKVDLAGKAVVPGFINTHIHPNRSAVSHYRNLIPAAFRLSTPTVRNWETKEQALAAVSDIVSKYDPTKPWIALNGLIRQELKVGAGTVDMNPLTKVQLSITKEDLDKISPNRPLVIALHGKYAGVANSKAIEAMLSVYGPDMSGIEKDARGQATGRINGPVAMHVIAVEFIPEIPAEHLATVYKKELVEHLAPFGITTFSTRLDTPEVRGFMLLDVKGEMPLRLAYGSDIGRFNPLFERDMRRTMEVIEGFGSEKIWLSGIAVGHPDSQPGASVCSTFAKVDTVPIEGNVSPADLCYWDVPNDPTRETVRVVARYGYRVSNVHSYGDKGLEIAVDTFDKLAVGGKRWALDHSQLFNPRVIAKSGELGMYWSLSPDMFASDRTTLTAFERGNEVANNMLSPVKALLDAGAKVTYEGEGEDANPMVAMGILVTRKDNTGTVRGARHAVDRKTALRIMTRYGAEYVWREDKIGTIEPGKLADLVVLDRNPLDPKVTDDQLEDIKVMMTLVGGEVVYDAATAPKIERRPRSNSSPDGGQQ